jgi:hypothetical protein
VTSSTYIFDKKFTTLFNIFSEGLNVPKDTNFFLNAERVNDNSTVFENGVELTVERFPNIRINLSRRALLAQKIDPTV